MASEKRLIYLEDAKEALIGWETDATDEEIEWTLDQLPKVDAVEVVRCNDCTYWKKATANKKCFLICPASGMEIMADDYCSYGERREEDV